MVFFRIVDMYCNAWKKPIIVIYLFGLKWYVNISVNKLISRQLLFMILHLVIIRRYLQIIND